MMVTRTDCYLALILLLVLFGAVVSTSRFTNIICKSFDESLAIFQYCRLTVPKRGTIALSLYAKILKKPFSNITINLSLFKKFNGYRPFLQNVSVDLCSFMANRKRFPFVKIYFDAFAKYSNFNHTCPFNHDIVFNNLVMRDDMFARFPIPGGEYMFKAVYAMNMEWKVETRVYLLVNVNAK
ncbi:uncharacterized protein LOC105224459 [Bactrocera dorsalis]|uniref:Uncharacterized protein LOC105224459 n=1 Tax=Bactrocera dorsalis TaxID=27457 RepID=A0A8N4L0D6_BACDO|nr:uncharacterized protein LOC105224459 [Bactrocera dorsalis]